MFYALCQFQTQYEAKSLKVSCIKAIRFLTLKFGITLYAKKVFSKIRFGF